MSKKLRPHLAKNLMVCALFIFGSSSIFAQLAYDDQMAKIDAQINLVRKQAELTNALMESAGPTLQSMPSVISITGLDGQMSARLLMPSGVVGTYREGDVVRNGMSVAAITPRLVTMRVGRGKRFTTVALDFMAGAAVAAAVPGMPMPGSGQRTGPIPTELLPAPPPVPMAPMMPRPSDSATGR